MGRRRQALLLMDANVLIDYLDSDRRVFRLATEHVGQIHVPTTLLIDAARARSGLSRIIFATVVFMHRTRAAW